MISNMMTITNVVNEDVTTVRNKIASKDYSVGWFYDTIDPMLDIDTQFFDMCTGLYVTAGGGLTLMHLGFSMYDPSDWGLIKIAVKDTKGNILPIVTFRGDSFTEDSPTNYVSSVHCDYKIYETLRAMNGQIGTFIYMGRNPL